MKSIFVFNYAVITFVSIYYFFSHLIKRKKNSTNIFFVLMMLFSAAEFILIIIANLQPRILEISLIPSGIVFLPSLIFIMMIFVTILFPAENIGRFKIILLILFFIITGNTISVFFIKTRGGIAISSSFEILKNNAAIIQSAIILLSIIFVPAPLILKIRNNPFRRIRTAIMYYLSGIFISCIFLFMIDFAGIYFYHIPLLQNPFIPIPVFLVLLFTNHLIYDMKNNDFQKFYKVLSIYILAFIIFFTPVYFFLRYYSSLSLQENGSIYIKSGIIFIYLVLTYRLINPYIVKFRTGKMIVLLRAINKTLMPDNEQKKYSDMDTFWEYITNDNFQNLKYTLGIQSAYFMLYHRKENTYQFTYGYGPDLDSPFIDGNSEIAKYITSFDGVFEKSLMVSETSIRNINPGILNFFNVNGIEISMIFKNMSDNIIGFLLLGRINDNKSYTSDFIDALEIFRIKIQNLLITDMILDEVTAEQVSEHDKIVVSTVKNRIIPSELASIPGIRISSLNINNSSYGGDYFDSVKISNDKTILFIAETSYAGIDSALIGMELFSILHSRTLIFNSPERVLNTMNQVIKTSRLTNSFARCSCVIVSSNGNFSYSNASHNQLMIFEPEYNSFTEIETENIPLGMDPAHRYTLTSGRLKDGSIGILYSDGLFSSCNEDGETFPQDILKQTIINFSRETPPVIARELYKAYNSFIGSKEQLSDVTVVIFKKVKADNEQH